MIKLMISSLMIATLMAMIMMMIMMISKKTFMDREKASPFECGFDPLSSSRTPFSLHFYLMAVIFLIFDVEIVLILPITIIMKYSIIMEWMVSSSTFIIILTMGLLHEWYQDMLEWTN
uniref:NADH-ubiquinone oxidoreductase chain 3 n=1 Tax=Phymatostetha punctata TaxID=2653493 RepID=A0A5J6XH97_9HEMI|nr:NADH dehydrogenase subunit 3 [Phymatostetha punctata]QFK69093.1 NADH dehydrogenase subunit 3 [Phymatostetha punctata]